MDAHSAMQLIYDTAKIIAVDFDGTLCKHEFPAIGRPNLELIAELVEWKKSTKGKLILWTCREDRWLHDAVQWCHRFGLEFDAINDNIVPLTIEVDGTVMACKPRKVFADFYLDDKALTITF